MVRIHPDPPTNAGAVAQLGEHLLCKQGVVGSIPTSSTNVRKAGRGGAGSNGTQRQAARAPFASGFQNCVIGCSLTMRKK